MRLRSNRVIGVEVEVEAAATARAVTASEHEVSVPLPFVEQDFQDSSDSDSDDNDDSPPLPRHMNHRWMACKTGGMPSSSLVPVAAPTEAAQTQESVGVGVGEQEGLKIKLRINSDDNQGGRLYMEDMHSVTLGPTEDGLDLEYVCFCVFDGHGGKEAAESAIANLEDRITANPNFWSDDDELVLGAIKDGFVTFHHEMWTNYENWPRSQNHNTLSTAGTTATVAFIRKGKLYMANVGDSTAVLGYEDPISTGDPSIPWKAIQLTKDHKPEDEDESKAIKARGGKVMVDRQGISRVAWKRPCELRDANGGIVHVETETSFLNIARSLGDFWSYNSVTNNFAVSPEPDVSVIKLDLSTHRCLIIATDGIWNFLTPQMAVHSVWYAENKNTEAFLANPNAMGFGDLGDNWINPAKRLIQRTLEKCTGCSDNLTAITVCFDPPGPTKARVLRQGQNGPSSHSEPSSSGSARGTGRSRRSGNYLRSLPR